jgi:hypothetical protein
MSRHTITNTILAGLAALTLVSAPSRALADGDPASDILATQSLDVPTDSGASPEQIDTLNALLTAAAHVGYAVRVAVIASPSDLGSIGSLWRQPQKYADYVGVELSEVAPGRVLVVMPNGFGLYQPGMTPAAAQAQLARTPAPPRGRNLAVRAAGGVENLAAASGYPIPSSTIHVVKSKPPRSRATNWATWLAWLGGAALILTSWTLSLRARPLRVKAQAHAAR